VFWGFIIAVSWSILQYVLIFSWSFGALTAAAEDTEIVGSPDNYAWIEAINTPVNIYMRPGMYTGPSVQVLAELYMLPLLYKYTIHCINVPKGKEG
jgi:hypothetical protein